MSYKTQRNIVEGVSESARLGQENVVRVKKSLIGHSLDCLFCFARHYIEFP